MFYVHELLFNRTYLEELADDVVVYDPATHRHLMEIDSDREARDARGRADAKLATLVRYLIDAETTELTSGLRKDDQARWCHAVMREVARKLWGDQFSRAVQQSWTKRGRASARVQRRRKH